MINAPNTIKHFNNLRKIGINLLLALRTSMSMISVTTEENTKKHADIVY